ncbi:MAG: hypothetical protein A2107_01930 [Verrucomicrobia bacterium GWF2_62_7]|nr:MAG: hypothetical protein A2107_01930 [Verrucomicrobia bacterium GWF2_62_7]
MKVLVADDDDNFRCLVTELLLEAGHEVAAEVNGRLAWERLQAEGADMAVLDVNMPEMDGFQLLRNIRGDARHKSMPVLMLTIRAFAEDQVQGYETGADDYLTKPFANDVFLARIKVLERRILKK